MDKDMFIVSQIWFNDSLDFYNKIFFRSNDMTFCHHSHLHQLTQSSQLCNAGKAGTSIFILKMRNLRLRDAKWNIEYITNKNKEAQILFLYTKSRTFSTSGN